MQVPKLEKIVVNIGLGEAVQNAKALDAAVGDLTRSPARSRWSRGPRSRLLRSSCVQGCRSARWSRFAGDRMYEFLDRLVAMSLPRIRDFRGISPNSFDGRGNYTLGLREQIIFPEIDYDKIDQYCAVWRSAS